MEQFCPLLPFALRIFITPHFQSIEEPEALKFFNSLSENEQHNYVKWIFSAKTDQTKINRIAKTLDRLLKNQKYYDKATL